MADRYRQAAARCPRCPGLLEARDVGGVEVDVCADCGGVWIDWFDGELSQVARQTLSRDPSFVRRAPSDSASRDVGCPKCGTPLALDFVLDAESILRCGDCAGAFLDRNVLEALVRSEKPSEREGEPSSFEKLLAVLRSLFGWS